MVKKAKSSRKSAQAKNIENFETVQSKREALEKTASLLFGPNKSHNKVDVNEDDVHLDRVSEQLLNFSGTDEAGVEHPPTSSNKRKRGNDSNQSFAGSKVDEWQARYNEISTKGSDPHTSQSLSKRPRTTSSQVFGTEQPPENASSEVDHSRRTQKELRSILKTLQLYPNQRANMKIEAEEADMMLKYANAVCEQTEVEVTEMQWIRYIIEEDVLRRQKQEPTLVDGTEKLGKHSAQGKAWKVWREANLVRHQPESMGWGYWKEKFYGPRELVEKRPPAPVIPQGSVEV